MKKTLFLLLLVCSFSSSPASAHDYVIQIGNINCDGCVDKLHSFFDKFYGKQVQHLNVNDERNRVTFDSISIDLNEVREELETFGFDVVDVARLKA